MTGEAQIPDVSGTIEEISSTSFTTQAGKQMDKLKIKINGTEYSAIGKVPEGVVKGDQVVLKLKLNGTFINIADILKNGVSVMPKFQGRSFGGSGKSYLVLAATLAAVHNAKIVNKAVTVADIGALMPELQKLAA